MMTLKGRLRSCFNDICIEAADKIDDLERQLANALVRDIHSCHPDCDRVGCVNARLRERIAALEREVEALRKPKPWERCSIHGLAEDRVWACPTCLVELRTEVAALRADAERLNYLSTKTRRVTLCPPGDHGGADNEWLVAVEVGTDRYGAFDEEFFGNDLRAAIDAARSKT